MKENKPLKTKWYEKITIAYNANAKNQIQTIDSLLFTRETIDNMRYGIQHKIPINSSFKLFKYINVSPAANYTERWYYNRIEKSWNEDSLYIEENTVNGIRAVRDLTPVCDLTLGYSVCIHLNLKKLKR